MHLSGSDPKVAHALLGTRGATHAERPVRASAILRPLRVVLLKRSGRMIQDIYYQDQLQGGGLNLVAMKGGEKVERIRKLYHEQMSPKAAGQWLELQRTHAYWLTSQLIEATKAGKEVTDTIERYALTEVLLELVDDMLICILPVRRRGSLCACSVVTCQPPCWLKDSRPKPS